METDLPAVLTIQLGINTPRYASLRAIKQAAAKPIELLSLDALAVAANAVGEAGSLSRVRRMYVPEKGRAQMIEGSVEEQARRVFRVIDALEDSDDVQDVYANYSVSDDIMEKLG